MNNYYEICYKMTKIEQTIDIKVVSVYSIPLLHIILLF